MIKLYGNMMSGPCKKVRYVAEAVNIDYEWVELDFKTELKTDSHLNRHPAGKIPAMEEDKFSLFESGAIIKYLADKQSSDLFPKDLQKRALIDQWTDFIGHHLGTAMGKVVYNRVFAPMMGNEADESSLAEGLKLLDRFFPIIDSQLSNNKHIAGDNLSLADISLLSTLDYAEQARVDVSKYKHLTKWLNQMKKQEFWSKFQN